MTVGFMLMLKSLEVFEYVHMGPSGIRKLYPRIYQTCEGPQLLSCYLDNICGFLKKNITQSIRKMVCDEFLTVQFDKEMISLV